MTVNVLTQVLNRLQQFYNKNSLVQTKQEPEEEKNRPGFSAAGEAPAQAKYEQHGSSQGAMGLIENIINDAKRMDAEVSADENKSQQAYAQFVTDANATVAAAQDQIASFSGQKAAAETKK